MSEDSLKTLLAKNEIELGNLFLTEMELFDSAYYYYDHVLTYYPYTSHQANALYAMGSYYLNTNQKQKADSLFNYIYENYRNESIVNAAANQLNKPLIDLDFDPAKEIYLEAEHELLSDNIESSLDKFYNIYKKHPKSVFAPKALYTTGWILENELNLYDSAAVIYDSLAIRYPQSEYTTKVRPKLSTYKQYQAQLQKAIEDSLKRMEDKTLNIIQEDSLGLHKDSTYLQPPPDEEALKPDSEFKKIQEVKSPDIKLPSDTSRSVILNNPRRNPRKK
jgi:outer membrane protein assembly factor BamD (BamD/ComL family)